MNTITNFIDSDAMENDDNFSYHINWFTGSGHNEAHRLAEAKTEVKRICGTAKSSDNCDSLLDSRTCLQNRYNSVQGWSSSSNDARRVRSRNLKAAKYYLDPVKGWYSAGQCDAVLTTSTPGCTDQGANNYNSNADQDDGSCIFPSAVVYGCTDSGAKNYDSNATNSDGSCQYEPQITTRYGCMDPSANNYDRKATIDNASCTFTMPDNIFTPPINPKPIDTGNLIDDEGVLEGETDNKRWYIIGGVLALTLVMIIIKK